MEPWVVLTFGSLQDLSDFIEGEIERSKRMSNSYNERLGELLREKESKDGGKKIKISESGRRWMPYGRLMLYGGQARKGEAEILFGTVDDLKARIQNLEEAKKAVANLSKVGLGETPIYLVQFRNSVPSRIVVSNPTDADRPRLKYNAELIIPSRPRKAG